jgi:hypothetical protein
MLMCPSNTQAGDPAYYALHGEPVHRLPDFRAAQVELLFHFGPGAFSRLPHTTESTEFTEKSHLSLATVSLEPPPEVQFQSIDAVLVAHGKH